MPAGKSLSRVLIGAAVTVSSITAVSFASTGTASAADCAPTTSFVGTDTVLKFTNVGTCTWNVPAGVTQVRALVIGGGGAGGKSTNAGGSGGGGAGAMVVHPTFAVSGAVSVTVGAGGATTTLYDRGAKGSTSGLGSLTATGGGGGGDWCDNGCQSTLPYSRYIPGEDGGSGGGSGAGLFNSAGGAVEPQSLPAGATSYGNKGGDAVLGGPYHGAGGGGAGAAGADKTPGNGPPTAGGIGRQSDITGVNTYYAAGGGGSAGQSGGGAAGGTGGGGDGGGNYNNPVATAGQANTGSGGGGGQNGPGGAGGSGVVVVRFSTVPVNSVAPTVSGTVRVGDMLTASTGTWAGSPVSYAYQWKKAATAGGAYSNIASATSSTYTLTNSDVAGYLKVEVTATNVNGAGSPELSTAVGPVSPAPTTTTIATTTTTTSVPSATTTVAAALEIVVNAPGTTAAPTATVVTASSVATTRTTISTKVTTAGATTVPPVTTTSTTLPNNTGATVAPPVPKPATVVAGQAGLTVGDSTVAAQVTREDNQLVVTAGDVTARLGSVRGDGSAGSLDADGNVRLRQGERIRITLNGFKPGTTVEVWLFSSPVMLGTAKVGYDGRVVGDFAVPANVPKGAHRITVVARTEDDKPATLTVGVLVGEWDKGPAVALWLIITPIVLAVIGALAIPATRRRRRSV